MSDKKEEQKKEPQKNSKSKISNEKSDFVKWFSELNKDSGGVAGGKGANLGEIYNLKIPVPPGFVVTAQAYNYFIEKAGIKEKIHELLGTIDYEDTSKLDEVAKQIRAFIEDSKMPKEMEDEILEAYEHMGADDKVIEKEGILNLLNKSSETPFVAVRSSATTEDLADASFAGQQDTYLNIKGEQDLLKHVKKCFASLFTSRATYYRNKKGFKHESSSLAVIVQKMVDSYKSGVVFSKDPSNMNDNIIIEAVWGLGEGIVSGKITPDKYVVTKDLEIKDKKIANKKIAITRDSAGKKKEVKLREEKSEHQVLADSEIRRLAEYGMQLEEHYKKPQDIEFAIENNEIFIVQTRPITTIANRVKEGSSKEIQGEAILQGQAASPGIGSGKVKVIEDLSDLSKIQKGDILVTGMTNPDMVVSMQKSAAIITNEGGLTAHAAIVSREMGIPCVVGTQNATETLTDGMVVTVDGFNGKIYKGKVAESVKKEVKAVEAKTKTEIKVIVDLPSFAERAAKTGLKKIGLTRIEGIIAESGKHPNYFLEKNQMKDYEKVIFEGIDKIASYFEEIWVRSSDIRSDEYAELKGAPKEPEANPMLGMHGIRYGLKHKEILKSELGALKKVAEKGKKVGVLFPQVISVEELKAVKKIIKEINFSDVKVGIMIETPAAVQSIRDFCEDGIDFISFGTNDLTQYMLAIDRGNQQVQHLYNEMHPAILYQLAFVIRVCKRYNVESSICGQAGSKKKMAKYLVEKGIDSISVNADVAAEIADFVSKVERGIVEGTDEEPRKYHEKKQEETKEKNENSEENSEEEIKKQAQEKTTEVEEEEEKIKKESKESDNPEQKLEEDLEAIEEEKQEYVKEHPEEKEQEENLEKQDSEVEVKQEENFEKETDESLGNPEDKKEKSNLDIF